MMSRSSRRLRAWLALSTVASLVWSGSGCAIPDHPIDKLANGTFFTFTIEDERELGEEFLTQVEDQLPIVRDSEIVGYVQAVGAEVARSAGRGPFELTFAVIRDPRINAFAGPAGYIFVHTGLLLAARSDAELAAVLSHEAAHVRGRHIALNIESSQKASIAALAGLIGSAVIASSGGSQAAQLGQAGMMGTLATAQASMLAHTREMEDEADRQGMRILAGAGYSPRAMSGFFHRLMEEERRSPIFAPPYLLTHPEVSSRIGVVEDIAEHMPQSGEVALAAGDLGRVQARAPTASGSSDDRTVHDRLGMALALKSLGRLPDAYDLMRSVLAEQPEYARGWAELGEILEASQRLDDAVVALARAHRLQAADPDIDRAYGRVLRALGRPGEAEQVYRLVVDRIPDDAEAHQQLGVVLGEQGRTGEASLELAEAALLDRDRRLAVYHYQQARDAFGKDDERVKALRDRISATRFNPRREPGVETSRSVGGAPVGLVPRWREPWLVR
ncbi:MAG: M48 family metalloprotease [Deltaproteobacteria bacterium]|nr:M48 family metalloprotease [Deltaproteobacteria bacterium]